jgi:hypothetical protein
MRVAFKHSGKTHRLDFRLSTSRFTDIILLAKTSKDLDILNPLTDEDGGRAVKEAMKQKLEFRLSIPINIDHNYDGAGFGFNVDFYGVIKNLK